MSEYGTSLFVLCSCREAWFANRCFKFAGVLVAMMASTIPVSILGVKFAMRVVPFWTPEQFSQYRHRCFTLTTSDSDLHAVSPRYGHVVWERDRDHHGVAELRSERARVSCPPTSLNAR
jgi:hypothetical protein